MKGLALALFLTLLVSSAHAADTCSTSGLDTLGVNSGKYEILLTCTADAGSNFSYTFSSGIMDIFDGKYIYLISSHSNTVSDGAELEIRDTFGRVILDANGNGNDFLNQAATPATMEYPSGPNTDHYHVGNDTYPLTIYAENIGASGGTINILFTLTD